MEDHVATVKGGGVHGDGLTDTSSESSNCLALALALAFAHGWKTTVAATVTGDGSLADTTTEVKWLADLLLLYICSEIRLFFNP